MRISDWSSDVCSSDLVVGDGPALGAMRQRYPDALFLGALHGEELAAASAAADVFVFPSLTDTFGLVMIEALARRAPAAGFAVRGPRDGLGPDGGGTGHGQTQHGTASARESVCQ